MKLLVKLLGLVLLLVVVAVLALLITFDANLYKEQIEQQVAETTGRQLDITGDISLSFIPIGVELGQVELANAPGFEQPVFARIDSLLVRVRLLPLLTQTLQVDALSLQGLSLFLEIDAAGANNWQDLAGGADPGAAAPAGTDPAAADEPVGTDAGTPPLAALAVNGISIEDAAISFDDRQSGSLLRVSDFSLVTGAIEFGKAFDMTLRATLSQRQGDTEQTAVIDLATRLTLQQSLQQVALEDLRLDIDASVPALQQQPIQASLAADIDVDLAARKVVLADAVIDAMDTRLTLDASVADWDTLLAVDGTLASAALDPRRLAARFAVDLPPMQAADALSRLEVVLPFSLAGERLSAQPKIVFDETRIDAKLDVVLAAAADALPAVNFALSVDTIDLNRYLPPASEDEAAAVPPPADAAVEASDLPIPAELLRKLDVTGEFTAGKVVMLDYEISELAATVAAQRGVVRLSPVTLGVLEGRAELHSTLDVRTDTPRLAQKLDVKRVQIGSIANDIVAPLVPGQDIDVSGSGDISVDVNTSGRRISTFIEQLQGVAVIDFDDIIADGLDVEYLMSTVLADFTSSNSFPEKVGLTNQYRPKTETAFELIHARFDITDGVARTADLLLDSSRIDVTGKGWVDIGKQTLDMDIVSDLTLYKVSSVTDNLADEPLPVRLHGPWTALAYDVDYGPMKKRFQAEYTDKLKARVSEKTEAVEEKVEQKKDEAVDKVGDKIKDKLKDNLKGLFR